MQVLTVDYRQADAAAKFSESLKNTGFAVLSNHPLNWAEIESVYKEWLAFFNSEDRFNYPFNPKGQDGYIPPNLSETAKGNSVKDLKEFYHLYFPNGRYPASISNRTKELFNAMFNLSKELLDWIEQNLPQNIKAKLSCSLKDMLSMERTLFRILHYPPLKGNEQGGAIRAAAHEDINLITLLPAATEPGLQVMDINGNWLDVTTNPQTLVVNIGDMLQEATRGFYRSTTHRVINPAGSDASKPRLSMPLFVHPRADAILSERYTGKSYLDERLRELGLLEETTD
ncbi:MAG: isopenicillin synthase [Gammaproteobacteria bacterium]|jgi:isopenicillin N synthase-like dioxygenase|nr:isopenicillin synthase [Gammaproteobacteria bacterium]